MGTRLEQSTLPSEASWQQIDHLLATVAGLARCHLAENEFARQVLKHLLEALPASAAGFWKVDEDGQIALQACLQKAGDECPESLLAYAPRFQAVQEVVRTKAPKSAEISWSKPPNDRPSSRTALSDRGAHLLCPVTLDDRCIDVIELIQADSSVGADRQWALEVLASVAELCADDRRQRQVNRIAERERLWRRLRQFSLEIHRTLDVDETAYAVVNEGRSLVDCDRLTLLSGEEGQCRVLAMSGAATFDRRSDAVKRLEELAAAIRVLGEPFVFPAVDAVPVAGDSEAGPRAAEERPENSRATDISQTHTARNGDMHGLPPQVREPLLGYLDASGAKSLAVVPLIPSAADRAAAPAIASAVLVAEQYSQGIGAANFERLLLAAEHAAPALRHAQRFRQAPWMALVGEGRWERLTRGRSRLRIGLYVAAALFVLSWIIPASYEIEARGELQPRLRRDLFATDDAVVEELKVDHDDRVEAGQVLAILRNPQLDLESKRLSGELQTARERLAAVQAARVEMAVESAGRPAGAARLSGEEAGLRSLLSSLERQSQLIDEQQAALTIRSPIAGRVLTWDLPQLLQSRPVLRGQSLMTIADPEGPWVLELHVPERRAGALLSARQGREQSLPVTFVLATDPGRRHAARIDDVGASIEPDRSDEPTVLVTVGVQGDDIRNPRPGAGATGRINCGLRPVAYVWFHDLIDAAWAWIWY
jgi:multidrug efflux pump subunit AcrA (membrane-fusion protein)